MGRSAPLRSPSSPRHTKGRRPPPPGARTGWGCRGWGEEQGPDKRQPLSAPPAPSCGRGPAAPPPRCCSAIEPAPGGGAAPLRLPGRAAEALAAAATWSSGQGAEVSGGGRLVARGQHCCTARPASARPSCRGQRVREPPGKGGAGRAVLGRATPAG